jgi:competence protein ComEC
VDAGPSSPGGWDAGYRRVLPYLRRQGARRLEALVLTHAHLDHVGGAPALLRGIPVRGVLEPARVTASGAYLETLREARARGVGWWPAEAGRRIRRGPVHIDILHPEPRPGGLAGIGPDRPGSADEGPGADPNRVSVVLLVRYGEGALLLTGDAYEDVEVAVLPFLPRLTLLKAGHHGSRTSTSRALLEATSPELAVISAGDGNRYGHPHGEVLDRLEAVGSRVYRTDRDGTIRIRIRRNGTWEVRTSR